jgi:hypothetical protein
VIGVTLRTQCESFAEEGSRGIDVLKMLLNIAFKAGKREVGESCYMIRMADQTLVKNQLKTLHSVIQVRDRLARRSANCAWPASVSRAISQSMRNYR